MESINLFPVNTTTPTDFTRTTNTLLDLFLVNNLTEMLNYEQLCGSAFFKHDIIVLSYKWNVSSKEQIFTYRDFNNVDCIALENEIRIMDWNRIVYTLNVYDKLNILNKNIVYLYNKYVPLKCKKLSKDKTLVQCWNEAVNTAQRCGVQDMETF